MTNERKEKPKEADYLHPEGEPTRPPKTKEEARNEAKAEELTELAEELKPDK